MEVVETQWCTTESRTAADKNSAKMQLKTWTVGSYISWMVFT